MPKPLTLGIFQAAAREMGGECLSTAYVNIATPLRFRCANGHEWDTRPSNIRHGNWCPLCNSKPKHTIEAMRALAQARGGKCLSTKYLNANSHLTWQCAEGHQWKATGSDIKNARHWCPVCARQVAGSKTWLGLNVAQQSAAERGGVCLTAEYPTGRKKLFRWRCADGHEWEMPISAVRHQGQWCPVCASGLSERFCRAMFEQVFDASFAKARPKWLKNDRGNQMELDGFNRSLRLAFEFHGPQHFKENLFFHRSSPLEDRIRDDAAKRSLCAEHGVALIEVPHTVKYQEMQQFIYECCERQAVKVARKPPIELALLDFYPSNDLVRLRSYAEARGGVCMAEYFPGVAVPVRWRCAEGHEWERSFNELRRWKVWCPVCEGKVPLVLADMQRLARERGGECLAQSYSNIMSRLRWRCAKGHVWEATANDVRNSGSWCPKCAGVARLTIDDARGVAAARGGECLSTEYRSSRTKMRWRCRLGHEWDADAGSVMAGGKWCAVCSRKARLTIDEMRSIATERGGECLSDKYVNLDTKLHWRCAHGHDWWATPNNVKHARSWCPLCAHTVRGLRSKEPPLRKAA